MKKPTDHNQTNSEIKSENLPSEDNPIKGKKTTQGYIELPSRVEPSSFVDVHSVADAARERMANLKKTKK